MAEINKSLILLFELLIAIGAILFLAGLCIGIFKWAAPITSEIGVVLGGVVVLIFGFALALYTTRSEQKEITA
ncbi:hypothetical protein [Methanimicrococcus blatticola]|uniref:Uncharacterized protein n=1 Tax=Methanimicrococcus blatticola TaxID=91560 RepID=A0A484F8G5_9EURY|nr:hypothetical protein [Methanimicrococcus blatticola]MBZ3935088.1 hypothetical protein [Methanimicrococcus blatticola]MCC2508815.1 hypothetical protein [Methanimicrococcus blatticola]TDQ71156.1 hypothetical protein C7391_0259 [Methanimicrococcus blatticola]